MVLPTTINLTKYENIGLVLLKRKRQTSKSELIREAVRLLIKQEGISDQEIIDNMEEAI